MRGCKNIFQEKLAMPWSIFSQYSVARGSDSAYLPFLARGDCSRKIRLKHKLWYSRIIKICNFFSVTFIIFFNYWKQKYKTSKVPIFESNTPKFKSKVPKFHNKTSKVQEEGFKNQEQETARFVLCTIFDAKKLREKNQ